MLEWLTIIIATIIVLGGILIATSKGDHFVLVGGMMITVFGLTALYWTTKSVAPHLRKDSTLGWLYKLIASLPEWVGHVGFGATVALWAVAVVFMVDDFVHLPRRKKGGRV